MLDEPLHLRGLVGAFVSHTLNLTKETYKHPAPNDGLLSHYTAKQVCLNNGIIKSCDRHALVHEGGGGGIKSGTKWKSQSYRIP